MSQLTRGDLLPKIVTPPPGPRARALAAELDRYEAPGINTLQNGQTAMLWEEALGSNVLDVDGNRYIDMTSGFGVTTIGHRHPKVVEAVKEQADKLLHGLGDVYAHEVRVKLAKKLCEISPIPDTRVYFAVSGADAVEIALKTAQLYTGKPDVLCFEPSYHGLTLGALAVTSRKEFREPFQSRLGGWVHRLSYGCDPSEIEDALRRYRVGSVIVEPVVGREGPQLPPGGWLSALGELARAAGALVVADEILTAFFRCGEWFAAPSQGLAADLVCCGKGLAGGLPIGAVLGTERLLRVWSTGGEANHTATFVAHPLACAAALSTVDVLDQASRVLRAAEGLLAPHLERANRRSHLAGRGLLFSFDPPPGTPAQHVASEAAKRGVLVLSSSVGKVQLLPNLQTTTDQWQATLTCLAAIVEEAGPGAKS